jgi:TctA family transporter
VNNNPVDVYLCAALGALGYALAKLECEPAPLLLGYVLGPLFETALRQSLTLSHGSGAIFVTRPISATLLALALIAVAAPLFFRRKPITA